MTEQASDKIATFISTDYRDIFGYENIIELDLSVSFLEKLLNQGVAYMQAKTVHQAEIGLIREIVNSSRKIGVKEVGKMAIEELAQMKESQK